MSLSIGLVHYPIYNRRGEIVTTAVTNYDVHDIARAARTYGVQRYFLIHPQPSQAKLVRDIMDYWQTGYGAACHVDRKEAFRVLELAEDIAQAKRRISELAGQEPLTVGTDARVFSNTVSYRWLKRELSKKDRPYLLLFGTGWGIERETMATFDYILEPVYGPCDYNHLSVRSAVSIILDRLCGEPWWEG